MFVYDIPAHLYIDVLSRLKYTGVATLCVDYHSKTSDLLVNKLIL